jgi:hypothetical protein
MFNYNLTIITGTLCEHICTFVITSRSVLLTMRNVSDKSCTENQNTHCVFSNLFSSENRAVCEIMRKNIVQLVRPQMIIWRMCIACWIPKATNTHSGYVTFIAFPLQQWLHERVSMLRYTYIVCLVTDYKEQNEMLYEYKLPNEYL